MINFRLKAPKEIVPWGKEDDLKLHWFGLTDSFYWIQLGNIELLRYSEEFEKKYNENQLLPYVDYFFARLLWDFIDIINQIIIPIPDYVFNTIKTIDKFNSYLNSLSFWLENKLDEDDFEYDEIYIPASEWIFERRLDTGYLVGGPDIYFFRNGDKIIIRWLSDYKLDDGTIMWKESSGEYIIEYCDFIRDLENSINEFSESMNRQIENVLNNPLEGVSIDKEEVIKAQFDHKEQIVKVFKSLYSSDFNDKDWKNIFSKVNIIIQ